MAWQPDELDRIGGTQELQISTYRDDGTLRRFVPIWVVRVGDDLYVRSALGPDGAWYRNAVRRRAARIKVGGAERDVALEPAADPATNADIDAAYRAKYRGHGSSLRTMIEAPASATSLRLADPTG